MSGATQPGTSAESTVTLRAGSSLGVFVATSLVAVLLIADAIARGSWGIVLRSAPVGLLVLWVLWYVLVRPSIRIEPHRLVIANPGRVTVVPWPRVTELSRRLQIVVSTDEPRSIECWGSPFPKRRLVGRGAQSPQDDPAISVMRTAWSAATVDASVDAEAPVTRRWDVVPLAVGAALVVLSVIAVALP